VSGGPRDENRKPDPDKAEGWESLPEESEGSLAANPELEAALQEASEAIDEEGHVKGPEEPAASESFSGEEIERMAAQLVENRDKYVRLLADFDNFRRRAHKDRQDVIQYGHENLVKDLLSTVDNLDRAIEHAHQEDGGDLASLLEGVELVQREFYAVLAQHEVHAIDAEGCEFDPSLHEAMAQVQGDSAPPNSVIEVLQKGYRLRDRLLRPARVVVAKPPADEDDKETTE
jgi:molecular chaperone GrpE